MSVKKCLLVIVCLFVVIGGSLTWVRPYIVLSGSMEPAIPTGSLVLINSREKFPKQDEIIAYCLQDMIVTHRVKKKTEEGYITKGDANEQEDAGIVQQENVVGTCIFVFPWLGYFLFWLKKKVIWSLWFEFGGIFLLFEIKKYKNIKMKKEIRHEKKNI